jgi:hypothetical protein
MKKETTDFHEFLDGAYYVRKAAECAASFTEEQNAVRRESGRKPNASEFLDGLPDETPIDLSQGGLGEMTSLGN